MRSCLTLVLAALLSTAAGSVHCSPGVREMPQTNEIRFEDLRFTVQAERELHVALRRWIEDHSRGYRHVPLRQGGNFLSESWCRAGAGDQASSGCNVDNSQVRGTSWRRIEALHYTLPDAFGLVLDLVDLPATGPVGVHFSIARNGASIVGEGMTVSFLLMGEKDVVDEIHAGATMGIDFPDHQSASVEAPGGWQAELGRLAESPERLRETLRERLVALEKRTLDAIEQGTIQGFVEGPYLGGGIPPVRTRRPLSVAEKAAETRRVQEEIGRRRAFVDRHFGQMHAGLLATVPVSILLGR
jgi:hypothetical protein